MVDKNPNSAAPVHDEDGDSIRFVFNDIANSIGFESDEDSSLTDDIFDSDELETSNLAIVEDAPRLSPSSHRRLNLPVAYLVENEQSTPCRGLEAYQVNEGEELRSNEIEIVPVFQPLSVTVVQQSWKSKPIFKSFPILTFGKALYILYALILFSLTYPVSMFFQKRTRGDINKSISPSSMNLGIGSSWPSSSPTISPISWKHIGDAMMVGNSNTFVHGVDTERLDREQQFSLSYDGNLLAVAGNGRPQLYELKYNDTSNQSGSWYPMDNFLDFPNESYYTLDMSFDGMNFVIGQPLHDNSRGLVNIYKFHKNGLWEKRGQTLFGVKQTDWFGGKVKITSNGERIAVCALQKERRYELYTNIFDFDGSSWILYEKFENLSTSTHISTTGEKMIVTNNRIVTIYELATFSDTQLEFESIVSSVSLSDNGNFVAVGSSEGKYVRVYKYDDKNETYFQYGRTIQPKTAYYGAGVFLSSDGRRLATSNRNFIEIFELDDNVIRSMADMHLDSNFYYIADIPIVFSGDGNAFAAGFYGYYLDYDKSNVSAFFAM